jgi:hypothetical protein
MVAQTVKQYLEHEGLSLCSRKPTTSTHMDPDESMYTFASYFFKIHAMKGLNRV